MVKRLPRPFRSRAPRARQLVLVYTRRKEQLLTRNRLTKHRTSQEGWLARARGKQRGQAPLPDLLHFCLFYPICLFYSILYFQAATACSSQAATATLRRDSKKISISIAVGPTRN